MQRLEIDREYLISLLARLLDTPSPSGFTDNIVRCIAEELEGLGVSYELTRRGAIRATLKGEEERPDRAIVAHVDTLGAMVCALKDNGRLAVAPIGTWSSRFAEGGRVTVFTDNGGRRGTVLPLKASGHVYNTEVDTQPVSWENIEVRIDERVKNRADLELLGIRVGDFVAFDPMTEVTDQGYIVSRHLDDKAGVAAVMSAVKAVRDAGVTLPIDCHPLFTVFEEVGSGASGILHQDVAEMVSIDNGTSAPGQNTDEHNVTVAMMDSAGPYDWHLTRKLLRLADEHGIRIYRDVFKYYRSDAASAVEAGNDIRTALLCFGLDASHGYERTHIDTLTDLASLLALYMQSEPAFARDRRDLGPLGDFPKLPTEVKSGE